MAGLKNPYEGNAGDLAPTTLAFPDLLPRCYLEDQVLIVRGYVLNGWRMWVSAVLLGLIQVATLVIGGLSINFVEDPFPFAARVLITSFAAGMTLLAAVALFALEKYDSRSAWVGLLAYPAFFVWHVIALGTYVPDAVLAALSLLALGIAWPWSRAKGPLTAAPGR